MDRAPRPPDRAGEPDATRPAPGSETPGAARPAAPVVQRWRVVFRRPSASSDRPHRDLAEEWAERLADSGLPLARPEGRPRPPLAFAAPLPVRVAAEQEYADVALAERLPVWSVRERIAASLPADLALTDVFDVWPGAPALAAIVVAADYRLSMAPPVPESGVLDEAARRLLGQPRIERERPRGGGSVRYDLRPLVAAIAVDAARPSELLVRTRFDAERGAGRPEEVVAALAETLGQPIEIERTIRERLILEERPAERAPVPRRRQPAVG